MKKLSIGRSDFKSLIEDGFYYVDKSLLIKEVIEDAADVVLLPRPRRFGKTLNMTMLRYFFGKTKTERENRHLFHGLAIEKEPEFEAHFAKYPVIFLTFKDIKFSTWEETYSALKLLIKDEYQQNKYLLDANIEREDIVYFERILSGTANLAEYCAALKKLSDFLCDYHKQKVIIIMDEYDTPIHTAFYGTNENEKNFYSNCVEFFRNFLGAGLKDNTSIFKAFITGILRVARESIFSGLNNLGVYTTLNKKFSDKFGFTENEVNQLIEYYGIQSDSETIRNWYNGYVFGNEVIYNPWSIINFINQPGEDAKPYWVNTSSNEIIRDLIKESPYSVKTDLEKLLKDIPLEKEIDENIVFPDLKSSEKSIFSFLLFCGYLKAYDARKIEDDIYYHLLIPNKEIKSVFKSIIQSWFTANYQSDKLKMLLSSLTSGDVKLFEKILSDYVVTTLSYHDTSRKNVESVYQAFMLGLFITLSDRYFVKSNQESGYGRYDIALIPKDVTKKAIIMELKKIDEFEEETKDQALESALKQIEEMKYETSVREHGCTDILKLAVTFDGKRVWVKTA